MYYLKKNNKFEFQSSFKFINTDPKTFATNGPMTRKDLVSQMNTPRTTLYDNLVKLQKRKIVEKFTRNNGKRGRPLVFWKIK